MKKIETTNKEEKAGRRGDKRDANTCMALGVGVGAIGAASAAFAGAVCPLCFFVVPGLVSYGAYKRWQISQSQSGEKDNE